MNARDLRRRTGGRSSWCAFLVATMLLVGCGSTTPSASPVVTTGPTPSPPSTLFPTPTASPRAASTPTSIPPSPTPAPSAGSPAPQAPLAAVYAAIRPQNLRTEVGATAFTKGTGEITLVYEMVNASASPLVVPLTTAYDREAAWIGSIQAWIERLGPDPSLTACLPGVSRKGALYGAGGSASTFPTSPSDVIQPGQGISRYARIPATWTACFPAGQYRYHLEYRPLMAGPDDVIADATIDLELRVPTRWTATISGAGMTGTARLVLASSGGSGSSNLSLPGLTPGTIVSSEIRAAGCEAPGSRVAAPPDFVAALGGTYRQRWDFNIRSLEARRAVAADGPLSIRVTVGSTSTCAEYGPVVDTGATRPPTAWPGALLADDLGDGRVARASSETLYGRPAQAFDGVIDNMWNASRFPPAWIELDLGKDSLVTGIRLMPSQLPNVARTVHRIYGRADGEMTEELLHEFDGITSDATWMSADLAPRRPVRYVRVETVLSPSWVAWREIVVTVAGAATPSVLPEGTHDGSTSLIAAGDRCYANGWASDPDDRSRDVTVRILSDGSEVWRGLAGDYRPDLQAAGIGDGTASFWVDLRGLITPNVAHEIRVQAQDLQSDRWVDLQQTPRTITCTSG